MKLRFKIISSIVLTATLTTSIGFASEIENLPIDQIKIEGLESKTPRGINDHLIKVSDLIKEIDLKVEFNKEKNYLSLEIPEADGNSMIFFINENRLDYSNYSGSGQIKLESIFPVIVGGEIYVPEFITKYILYIGGRYPSEIGDASNIKPPIINRDFSSTNDIGYEMGIDSRYFEYKNTKGVKLQNPNDPGTYIFVPTALGSRLCTVTIDNVTREFEFMDDTLSVGSRMTLVSKNFVRKVIFEKRWPDSTDNLTQFMMKEDVCVDKVWTVKFSDIATKDKIEKIVVQKHGIDIPVKVSYLGNEKVLVAPLNDYGYNEMYYLKVFLKNKKSYVMGFSTEHKIQ